MRARLHELRCTPAYFDETWDGAKPFEVRWNDRGYQSGDTVELQEYDPQVHCDCPTGSRHTPQACRRYTGRTMTALIGHVLATLPPTAGGRRACFNGDGYVVFGLVDIQRHGRPANGDTAASIAAVHAASTTTTTTPTRS
jgi:hypothetical protein